MLSAHEYASYVQLCRELRLEREWERGDWLLWPHGRVGLYDTKEEAEYGPGKYRQARAQAIWLPTLTDWLSMLEEAGVGSVAFQLRPAIERPVFGVAINDPRRPVILPPRPRSYGCIDLGRATDIHHAWPYAPTREEAAARLWMAVTAQAADAPSPSPPSG